MWEYDKSQLDITNQSQEVSPIPAGNHKAAINKAWQTQDINNTNAPQKKYHLGTVSKNILLEGLNQLHGDNLTLTSYVEQDIFRIETKHNKHDSQEVSRCEMYYGVSRKLRSNIDNLT